MAQRGGSVVAQIRFGARVFSPLVPEGTAQVLASLERIEALRFASYLARDGLAVVSTQAIIPVTVSVRQAGIRRMPRPGRATFKRLTYLDAVSMAEKLRDARVANVILGHVHGADPAAGKLGGSDLPVREAGLWGSTSAPSTKAPHSMDKSE